MFLLSTDDYLLLVNHSTNNRGLEVFYFCNDCTLNFLFALVS